MCVRVWVRMCVRMCKCASAHTGAGAGELIKRLSRLYLINDNNEIILFNMSYRNVFVISQ